MITAKIYVVQMRCNVLWLNRGFACLSLYVVIFSPLLKCLEEFSKTLGEGMIQFYPSVLESSNNFGLK